MEFMDSNIRIITGLIMQEMQNYIYNESMYLVQVETSLTHRVKILISGMAVLTACNAWDPDAADRSA